MTSLTLLRITNWSLVEKRCRLNHSRAKSTRLQVNNSTWVAIESAHSSGGGARSTRMRPNDERRSAKKLPFIAHMGAPVHSTYIDYTTVRSSWGIIAWAIRAQEE